MIYTLTLSPTFDYSLYLDEFKEGGLNLTKNVGFTAGGKGIIVSKIASVLEERTIAYGYVGGFIGDYIKRDLKRSHVKFDFVDLDEISRINIQIKNNGTETEIAGLSPNITEDNLEDLFRKLKAVEEEDILVMAGSIPKCLDRELYKKIRDAVPDKTKVVLDTRGNLIKLNLNKNFMIKPNIHELEDMFGKKLETKEEVIKECQFFLNEGVENVIVSMGGDGALLIRKDANYLAIPAKGELRNSVGAGDSLVAGFMTGISRGQDVVDSFRLGVSCGTATAYSFTFATKEEIEEIYSKTEIKKL